MSGFKLLAIRPLVGCDKRFLKNLQEDQIYKFYNDFEFNLNENGDVASINDNSTVPKDLFGHNISVSAIVGKNGSGKSTIIELFNSLIFNLSVRLDLINVGLFKTEHKLNLTDIKRMDEEIKNFDKLCCEIFYMIGNDIFCIKKNYSKINSICFKKQNEKNEFNISSSIDISSDMEYERKHEFLNHSFFYSIIANYSLYGQNTNETGIWLKSLFHKNDGYQTPLVLNPMRTEGVIDINRLTYLSKSRLLFNVFRKLEDGQKEEDSLRNLVNNKIVEKVILNLDFTKFTNVEIDKLKPNQSADYLISINDKNIYLEKTQKYRKKLLLLLLKAFYPNLNVENLTLNQNVYQKLTIEYVLGKVYDVFEKYPQFKGFRKRVFSSNSVEKSIIFCFEALAKDFSHSTFKIRQALNFLVYNFYGFSAEIKKEFLISSKNNTGITEIINNRRESFLETELSQIDMIDFDDNQKFIYNKHSLINYLPPSFFEIDFEFKDKGLFKDLSSGEKQMVYSINSLVYHLFNLKSIESEDLDDRISYNYFNIILDEIELYFHPEFQRKYLYELLRYLKVMNFIIDGVNILFLTHSPFILSDIPHQNVLKLKDGDVLQNSDSVNTFGANIHDLLANDFFLENGFMGEFAKSEINHVIDFLNFKKIQNQIDKLKSKIDSLGTKEEKIIYENELINKQRELTIHEITNFPKIDKKYCKQFIELIGEPMLSASLMELYIVAYPLEKKDFIQVQIDRLTELMYRDDSNQ